MSQGPLAECEMAMEETAGEEQRVAGVNTVVLLLRLAELLGPLLLRPVEGTIVGGEGSDRGIMKGCSLHTKPVPARRGSHIFTPPSVPQEYMIPLLSISIPEMGPG